MRDLFEFFSTAFIAAALLSGGIILGANYWQSYRCDNYEKVTGKATRWMFMDECYVQTEAGWLRWDEYRYRLSAREKLKIAP